MTGPRPRVVVLTAPGLAAPSQLDAAAAELDVEVEVVQAEELARALPGARALFLWDFFSAAVQDAWPAADVLEWIHVAAAGVDSLLFEDLRRSDVTVTNAHGVFDRPIAEFVLASILAHAKRLHESMRLQREHEWAHRETTRVQGQRVLVVGTGGIGREIARLLRAVGCEVRGAGRREREDDPDFGTVVRSDELAEHVGWADHVVNATPLTPQTRGLLDGAVFAAMRPEAHVVNIGRGASLVEADLLAALREGRLAGASLDVFGTEPLPDDSPLWDAPGLVASAHLSGDVVGWRDRLAEQFVANLRRWRAGEPLTGVVDTRLGYVPGRDSGSGSEGAS
ncbi:D-3-phosphoglycerate dehydrogenase [Serinicoccus hydrothermalis]|uniref:D-3-phosphoglycerate dehydrogenase n=1 Tax=Serinicoccus hydrothermalis TaxID=1758689 RepID=A0A1B1N8P8_9MICO|nr:D-2-hydroxyacid dehydrogenase [Serinicoccus hydrothermalis]ANS77796.1 D-3-phosphoglycerate dehydrogenase [Serinicoccus hydrothermalis]